MLVNGKWSRDWDPVQKKDAEGRFIREDSSFRERVTLESADASEIKQRFHLYVAYICPWATRTLISRSLLGLEEVIDVSVVEPFLTDLGWRFKDYPSSTPLMESEVEYIHQLYTRTKADYTGRATVPVLWDNQQGRIINNESADIVRIFNDDFRKVHQSSIDLYPEPLRDEIDTFNEKIYHSLNNGVYRAGFASTQSAYEEAYKEVFDCLDWLEHLLGDREYAMGDVLTESDIRLFVTLVRFDVAYHGLFKTNKRQIFDYLNLSAYLEQLLSMEAFAKNTNIDHIKAGYYSIKALNPKQIIPVGPELEWLSMVNHGDQ